MGLDYLYLDVDSSRISIINPQITGQSMITPVTPWKHAAGIGRFLLKITGLHATLTPRSLQYVVIEMRLLQIEIVLVCVLWL